MSIPFGRDYAGADGWLDEAGAVHDDHDTLTDEECAERAYARELQKEERRQRVRADAARLIRAETTADRPPARTLTEFLAVPDPEVRYLVDRLLPEGGTVVLAAQRKAGKTTLVGNLVRCLADGDALLGEYRTQPVSGRVVLLDTEMSESMLRRWTRDQAIANTGKVAVVSLRGRVSSFDILDPAVRAQWAVEIAKLDGRVLILDCLRPVLDSLGLDEDHDAGRLLVAFAELLRECGATEGIVVHHMGHAGERSRGSSRLRDWPDVEWKLVRQDPDDDDSPRFFCAYGRDVNEGERELGYDPDTRHLTIAGGSRKDGAAAKLVVEVLGVVQESNNPPSGNVVEKSLTLAGHAQKPIRAAVKMAIVERLLSTTAGPRGAVLHHLTDAGIARVENLSSSVRRTSSPVRQRAQVDLVTSSIEDEVIRTNEHEASSSGDEVRPPHDPVKAFTYDTELDAAVELLQRELGATVIGDTEGTAS